MIVDVVQLPRDLTSAHVEGRAVVVFDVLRATTTMTAALAMGVAEIFVQPSLDDVRIAAGKFGDAAVTCGELNCVQPAGFTLGNSPGGFTAAFARRTVFMATTNGTKAILAAVEAKYLYVGALVNASSVARAARASGADVALLCSGTDGLSSMEDTIGAGAVLDAIIASDTAVQLGSDVALMALELFRASKPILRATLARTRGGTNIIRNGLQDDIDFAARLDVFDVVGQVDPKRLRITKAV